MQCSVIKNRLVVLFLSVIFLSGSASSAVARKTDFHFPYQQAGLTKQAAAAHLLSRFTFGARPGQVDEVVKTGLEKWFRQQLEGNQDDDTLGKMLQSYDALPLSNAEIFQSYPNNGKVLRMAVKEGIIEKDSAGIDRARYRESLKNYMALHGLKPRQELYRQLISQKILRAVYSSNQLREVLTDFWFNHFNVSITKGECAPFILSYERDVIRPHVTGKFSDLLLATAQSPAMLYYLDNFSSSATVEPVAGDTMPIAKRRRNTGLNENYAREVMELHTLGVDGGYSQKDVTEAARVLTGWTIFPMSEDSYNNGILKQIDKKGKDKMKAQGFVFKEDFLFNPQRHDQQPKTVAGHVFPAEGGYEEGVRLLQLLAGEKATASFICRKLAIRFVQDDPPQSLVSKMAQTFLEQDGDIRAVLITMVSAPEFWSPEAIRSKTKSPFELAVNAVRTLDAQVTDPYALFSWVNKMGQKIYYYQAPTGFPDKSAFWINTGALLSRMNFGLALAANRIKGIHTDLAALNQQHEPESADAALDTYCRIILPGRDLHTTTERLKPLLNDPHLYQKVAVADQQKNKGRDQENITAETTIPPADKNLMLAQVVGIIIGSPEFQRR